MAKSQMKYTPKPPQVKMPKEAALPELIDSQNKTPYQIFWGVLVGGELLAAGMLYFGVVNLLSALKPEPNWLAVGLAAVLIIFSLITAFGALRAALVMGVMMAARTYSFEACAKFCNQAIAMRAIIPGGVVWAVQTLLEYKTQKGEFDEVIEVGNREYEAALAKNPKEYGLGSICACVGTAYSMRQDKHKAVEWLEKGVAQYKAMFANLEKNGKQAKIPGGSDNIYLRYAESCLALAGGYLQIQDKRNAKDRLQMVFEIVKKVKDCPEKETLIKRAQEINKHLKHW